MSPGLFFSFSSSCHIFSWSDCFLLRLTGEAISPVLSMVFSHVFEFTWRLPSPKEPRGNSVEKKHVEPCCACRQCEFESWFYLHVELLVRTDVWMSEVALHCSSVPKQLGEAQQNGTECVLRCISRTRFILTGHFKNETVIALDSIKLL